MLQQFLRYIENCYNVDILDISTNIITNYLLSIINSKC